MRRSSINKNYLSIALLSLCMGFYLIMSSLYTSLPIFVGLFFVYIMVNYENEKEKLFVFLAFLYLTIFDLNKGFYLFSSLLTFVLFYNLFASKIKNFLTCGNCILAIYIIVAYIGHYLVNTFIAYILNQDAPLFSQDYLYYMLIDFILGIILFKGKI